MKNSELGQIIEKLGKDIARYDRKSLEAYQEKDFAASIRYHEKALALEKRVAKHLNQPISGGGFSLEKGADLFPRCLSC